MLSFLLIHYLIQTKMDFGVQQYHIGGPDAWIPQKSMELGDESLVATPVPWGPTPPGTDPPGTAKQSLGFRVLGVYTA